MIIFFIAFMLTAVAVLSWLLWQQQKQQGDENEVQEEDARISPLLRGINYLLSDEPDRALKELVHVAKLRTETAEVYLALGGMFRNRGEFGRAVRIHQNLLARPDLPDSLHLQAQLSLGQDFQAGGLLGRALQQYTKVLDVRSDHIQALEASLRIREQGHEWEKAEDLLLRLDRVRGSKSSLHQAYLITKRAKESRTQGDMNDAMERAKRAMAVDTACTAAYILLIELQLHHDDEQGAMESMHTLLQESPQHIPLLIPVLLRHTGMYDHQGRDFLWSLWSKEQSEAMALAWIEAVADTQGDEQACALIEEMHFTPRNLRACLQLEAITAPADKGLAHASKTWRKSVRNFSCTNCGMEVVEMRWQCPRCYLWGSMHPISEGVL